MAATMAALQQLRQSATAMENAVQTLSTFLTRDLTALTQELAAAKAEIKELKAQKEHDRAKDKKIEAFMSKMSRLAQAFSEDPSDAHGQGTALIRSETFDREEMEESESATPPAISKDIPKATAPEETASPSPVAQKRTASERQSATFNEEQTSSYKSARMEDDQDPSKTPSSLRRRPGSADLQQAAISSENIHAALKSAHNTTMAELTRSPAPELVTSPPSHGLLNRFQPRQEKLVKSIEPEEQTQQEQTQQEDTNAPRRTSRVHKKKEYPGYVVDLSNSKTALPQ